MNDFHFKNDATKETRVMHHAKATSAGSTEAGGSARGLLRSALAVLALAIAACAITAAPASAAASAEMGAISNVSYTSAHVTGKVTTSEAFRSYRFEYSTNENPTSEAEWTIGASGFFSFPATNETVQGDLNVPKGATKYFVRLTVANFGGPEATAPATAPYPSFTTLAVDPPTFPGAVVASPIFSTSATATGKVKRPANADPAFDVSACRFEYVTDEQFTATGFASATAVPCDQATPFTTPEGETEVTAPLTGLSPATTYHLRLAAENAAPAAASKEATPFTTNAKVSAQPAVLATGNATEVGKRSVQAAGEIERPAGADPALNVECRFEYVSEEHFTAEGFAGAEQTPCAQNPVTSSAPGFPAVSAAVSAELPGLTPGTTYHLRLSAENGAGTVSKDAAATFTTVAVIPPSFTVDSVSEVGYTSFKVTGTADPGNQGTSPFFEYSPAGKEEWAGNELGQFLTVPAGSPAQQRSFHFPCGDANGNGVFCTPPRLKPGTTYQVRLSGRDEEEFTVISSPAPYTEFTTKGTSTPPSVSFDPVTAVTGTGAHFSGTVDTHAPAEALNEEGKAAYKTEWEFVCTPECPAATGSGLSGTVTAEEGSRAISSGAVRLQPHTYYEVKLVAHNVLETVESEQPFETPFVKPTVESAPGGSDGEGGYVLEGIVNSNNSKITECRIEYGTTATYPNTYNASCLPFPSGPDEVQQVSVDAGEGQFKLSFRGQTTADLPFNATPAEVQAALRALSKIGPSGVNVTGAPQAYEVTFAGPLAGANVEQITSSNGTTPLGGGGGGGVSVSTTTEGGTNHPVSIEAHVGPLTVGSTYHFRIFATNAAGLESSSDRIFIPTVAAKGPPCPNEQLRKENNSTGLPECRAYEMVTYPNKEGNGANLRTFNGGDAVSYTSNAPNIAGSGEGSFTGTTYVSRRTPTGWETIPNLNGPTGSMQSAPEYAEAENRRGGIGGSLTYSADLFSSVWPLLKKGGSLGLYLRKPDGSFEMIAPGNLVDFNEVVAVLGSADLSHVVVSDAQDFGTFWGPGVYEFVGTGIEQPRRVDVDNSGQPLPGCTAAFESQGAGAYAKAVSPDGRVIIFSACDKSIWARVDGTTSYDASASQCTRVDCNAPAEATYQGAAKDGSRVYFTTTQQLVNGDTDETKDLYACDLPTTQQAPVGTANPCSALREVSAGSHGGADVQEVLSVSEDGSTAYFTAKGILADNEDALGEEAAAGDRNLYVWRTDAAHPAGQTTFVAQLPVNDSPRSETTPDGRYLLLQTSGRLVSTDTDNATDVYRYDAGTGEMARVSTGVSGAGGNGEFDAGFFGRSISDNGKLIAFTTKEALSPLDGNGEFDAYLWNDGHVLGSLGPAGRANVDGSGEDVYIETSTRLTASDVDAQTDVYDVRIDGGFPQRQETCAGEACQVEQAKSPAPESLASQGTGSGNPTVPKPCPKGKVKKHGKCVKKTKKHHKKAHKAKQASKNRGGAK